LLAVAQCGVKNYNTVFTHLSVFPGPPFLRIGFNKKPHRGDAAGGVSKFAGTYRNPTDAPPKSSPSSSSRSSSFAMPAW
jgi:hypothetical protein